MDENKPIPTQQEDEVKWYSYVALLFAIVFFSGVLATSKEWYSVFDFTVLNGTFGKIAAANGKALTFRGAGGNGCQDGFAFALSLLPAVIFALGVVNVVEGLESSPEAVISVAASSAGHPRRLRPGHDHQLSEHRRRRRHD